MLRKRIDPSALHEAQAAFRSKDPAQTTLFVRILQEAGKANKNCLCVFLDVRKAYDTV
jgi:hypothetical protein